MPSIARLIEWSLSRSFSRSHTSTLHDEIHSTSGQTHAHAHSSSCGCHRATPFMVSDSCAVLRMPAEPHVVCVVQLSRSRRDHSQLNERNPQNGDQAGKSKKEQENDSTPAAAIKLTKPLPLRMLEHFLALRLRMLHKPRVTCACVLKIKGHPLLVEGAKRRWHTLRRLVFLQFWPITLFLSEYLSEFVSKERTAF